MALRYTTDRLIAAIKRASHTPVAQTTFSEDDILALCDEEMDAGIVPMVTSVRENYYLAYEDLAIAGSNRYPIPTRAAGMTLVKVQRVEGTTVYGVDRIEVSQVDDIVASPTTNLAFYIEGNDLVILGQPGNGVIRMWFYRWPNRLVVPGSCGQIASLTTNTVTLASLPSGFTTAERFDLIKDQPGFDLLGFDRAISAITTLTLTFTSDLPSTLQVGDWVSLAGTSPVVQAPKEFQPLLTQRVVVRIYELQGYLDKMQAAQAKLKEKEAALIGLITPRVAEEPKQMSAWDNSVISTGFAFTRVR